MNKISFALPALLLISGCTTAPVSSPRTPQPHPTKFALQLLRIEVPIPDIHTTISSLSMVSDDIDALLKNPEVVVSEFPIVYASVGETAIDDQTTPYPTPKTIEAARDEKGNLTVVSSDETSAVGRYVEFTIYEIKNDSVSYHIVASNTQLAGEQHVKLKAPDGETDTICATRPIFRRNKIDTELTQAPDTWLNMGGSISEKIEYRTSGKVKKTRVKKTSFVRILSPSTSRQAAL